MAQTFTVPATALYTRLSNGGIYKFYEGDVIPLDDAIDLQMPGASAPAATNPFSGAQASWIAAEIATLEAADDAVQALIPTSVNDGRLTQARTATADGTGTGTIADGTDFVVVTSDDANKIIVLPTPTPGVVVTLVNGAVGYELRSSAPATVAINGGAEAGAESAIGANVTTVCRCVTATAWVCTDYSTAGVLSATQVAAAA